MSGFLLQESCRACCGWANGTSRSASNCLPNCGISFRLWCALLLLNSGAPAVRQGKRHQQNLAKRAAREAADKPAQPAPNKRATLRKVVKIGRPGYRVTKQYDPETDQRSLLFQARRPPAWPDTCFTQGLLGPRRVLMRTSCVTRRPTSARCYRGMALLRGCYCL